jgi:hypothetical protein
VPHPARTPRPASCRLAHRTHADDSVRFVDEPWTSEALLEVLAHPERFGLVGGVWYALNASDALVASHAEHTVAGRLGMCVSSCDAMMEEAGLRAANGVKLASMMKRLSAVRTVPVQLQISLKRAYIGSERCTYAQLELY